MIKNNKKLNVMKNLKELKEFLGNVNEVLESAKNVVKMRKALDMVKAALSLQALYIKNIVDWSNVSDEVYDVEFDLQTIKKEIEMKILTRKWTMLDFNTYELCVNNID